MEPKIVTESKKAPFSSVIGCFLGLCLFIFFGIFDIRKYGAEVSEGTNTVFYWIFRILCLILIPVFIFTLVLTIKQMVHRELIFKVSKEGIFIKISNKYMYNIDYKDIKKVTSKTLSQEQYFIYIFLKDPTKYVDEKQLIRLEKARKSIPEAGDINISSLRINEKLEKVLEVIYYYLNKEMLKK